MLIVGSNALARHADLGARRFNDLDFISTHEEAADWAQKARPTEIRYSSDGRTLTYLCNDSLPQEFMLAWPGSTNEEVLALPRHPKLPHVASLNTLYLLKMSHRYLRHSPHFEKTWDDIQLMRKLGATIPAEWQDLFKRREKETYTYKHPNLNQTKGNFFDPNAGINYIYDHDSIHLAMAHDEVPAYTKFKENQADVKVSRELWEKLPEEVKMHSLLEEAYVLALERSQIPYRGKVDPAISFKIALQRICSSISSGWWREWAWEHYRMALEQHDPNYVETFDRGVRAGIVQPYRG